MKVKITDGIQVTHDSTSHRGGNVIDVPDTTAYEWIGSGWATEVTPTAKKSTTRRRATT